MQEDNISEAEPGRFLETYPDQKSSPFDPMSSNEEEEMSCEEIDIDLSLIPKEFHQKARNQIHNDGKVVVTNLSLDFVRRAINKHKSLPRNSCNLAEDDVPKKEKKPQKNSSVNSSTTLDTGLKKSAGDSRHYNVLNVSDTRITIQKAATSSKKTSNGQYVDGILRSAKASISSQEQRTGQKEAVAVASQSSSVAHEARKVLTGKRKHSQVSSKKANKTTQTEGWENYPELMQKCYDLENQVADFKNQLTRLGPCNPMQ